MNLGRNIKGQVDRFRSWTEISSMPDVIKYSDLFEHIRRPSSGWPPMVVCAQNTLYGVQPIATKCRFVPVTLIAR